ncbi:MAG: CBS domain-containing protein [Actinomycetota bacterium]|nr:CBS domain-containing protein [Actinomycetota bacterium]
MPDSIVKETIREIEPLRTDDSVATAAKRVIELRLPGLPAVDSNGKFAGIFGEREFLAALFPGYMNELSSTAMIKRSIDYTIDRREECATESIQKYLTRDHVLVEDDYSDTQLAELFLHHRVLVIPIATDGRVHAVVTRADYFEAVARRFMEQAGS